MDTTLNIERLAGEFGVVVPDLDVTNLPDAILKQLLYALYEHRVVVLKTHGLSKAEFVAFARRVGDPKLCTPSERPH